MAPTIKILKAHEAIKIAAGEVVERPANIIKELLENSIDAGAQNITIHIQTAGKDCIKISDDGCGMSEQDAKLCFAHHATSKINSVNDLPNITTYGFRGEALSSIASVSKVTLITKTAADKIATQVSMSHGSFTAQQAATHAAGTTIEITDLFANIPARKKFLKSDDTEWNLIISIFQAFALRFLNIHFKIFHNDFLAFNCPPTRDIKTRCGQLWNNNLHDQLIELEPTTHKNISISGAISKTSYTRFNRGQIFTFVNNRWVKNAEIIKGVLQGYQGILPPQKYPAAFIFITIDPHEIDINIHPKKEEVKFLHPGIIQNLVQEIVQKNLSSYIDNTIKSTFTAAKVDLVAPEKTTWSATAPSWQMNFNPQKTVTTNSNLYKKNIASSELSLKSNIPATPQPMVNQTIYTQGPYSIIGQFKKTYIIIEKESELIFIDQHAAHERILYERFCKQIENSTTIQLLFPHIAKFSHHEIQQLLPYQQLFQQHGIIFEAFNDHEIIIQATPVHMQAAAAEEIIRMILAWAQDQQTTNEQFFTQIQEKIMAEKACKAAFRAGDTLASEQMQNLIQELQSTDNRFCCPHGRPTVWNLQLQEIEKHFKRDYISGKTIYTDF